MKRTKTKKTATLREKIALLLVIYPFGLLLAFFFYIGMIFDIAVVLHDERLACLKKGGKKIFTPNHPSLGDPFFIAALLLEYFVFYPLKYAPLIVADSDNFFKRWPFRLLDKVMVPIDRNDEFKKTAAFLRMREAVDSGRPVIMFIEGGRTCKGEPGEFLYSEDYKKTGNKIRFPQGGIAVLARVTGAEIIPIGITGSADVFPNSEEGLRTRFVPFKRVAFAVGEPMKFDKHTDKIKIVQVIGSRILSLMDEASVA